MTGNIVRRKEEVSVEIFYRDETSSVGSLKLQPGVKPHVALEAGTRTLDTHMTLWEAKRLLAALTEVVADIEKQTTPPATETENT